MNPLTVEEIRQAVTEAQWVIDAGPRASDAERRLAAAVLALAADNAPRVPLAQLTRHDFGVVGDEVRSLLMCEWVTAPRALIQPAPIAPLRVHTAVQKADALATHSLRVLRDAYDRDAARRLGERMFFPPEA